MNLGLTLTLLTDHLGIMPDKPVVLLSWILAVFNIYFRWSELYIHKSLTTFC